MLFRYDFDNKLDLSRFKKQSLHYIGCMPEVTYQLVVFDYNLTSHIKKIKSEQGINYLSTIQLFDLKRDSENEISESKVILPMNDPRFQEMKDFIEIFSMDKATGEYISETPEHIVNKLSQFIKMLNKLNMMKAFF
jgi:hypothetical protein